MDPKLVRIPQLTAARCKFDGLLQQIAERMDEVSGDEGAPEDVKPADLKQPAGVFQKPVKKKLETTAGTVITKIQDCSLDMALFSDSSVLYPMVRAWCRNDNSRECDDSSSSDEEEQDDQRIVTMMPPPHPRGDDVPRIPSGLPPHGCDVIPIATDGDDLPDAGYLLQEHLLRWKIVRQQWREASALNEARYFESCEILAKCQALEESSPEPQQEWDGIEPLP